MKKEIQRYLFEIIVIFIGITISFVFESWRKDREEQHETKKQLTLLKNDLERSKAWIEKIDSGYSETISYISRLKNGETLAEEDFSELMFSVFDNPLDFPLRDLSPYLSQVSKLSETSSISDSNEIITTVAYIETLVREDYELNKAISDYSDHQIWLKLSKNDFLNQIIKAEKAWTDTTIVWTEKQYSIKTFADLVADLSFVELKLRKIIIVHEALKRQIETLKEALSRV